MRTSWWTEGNVERVFLFIMSILVPEFLLINTRSKPADKVFAPKTNRDTLENHEAEPLSDMFPVHNRKTLY